MRERVEDLGRILVLVDTLLDLDVFDLYQGRNKDFIEYFNGLDNEKQQNLLNKLIYGIQDVKEKIYDISSIARGMDLLNEKDD